MTWSIYACIDTPTPFAPIEELRRFIADNEQNDHPQMRDEVEKVRRYLIQAQQHHN